MASFLCHAVAGTKQVGLNELLGLTPEPELRGGPA